jgi:hypothetical protein
VITSLARIGVQASEIEARSGNLDDAFIELTRNDVSEARGGVRS